MAQPATTEIPTWTLGDRLRKAREHAGLKQTDLAELTGIARSSIVRYESDVVAPTRPYLQLWAIHTGVSLDWLAGDEGTTRRVRPRTSPEQRRLDIRHYPVSSVRPMSSTTPGHPPNGRRPRRLTPPSG